MADAARETERPETDLLLGTILADRYLRTSGDPAELTGWLVRFGDQPEAPAIRGLLERIGAGTGGPGAQRFHPGRPGGRPGTAPFRG